MGGLLACVIQGPTHLLLQTGHTTMFDTSAGGGQTQSCLSELVAWGTSGSVKN